MPALSVVRHQVADYDAWRRVYDDFADVQRAGGVTAQSVYRDPDDPDSVLVLHHYATLAQAEAFFARADLKDAMRRAGVQGPPRIELYESA